MFIMRPVNLAAADGHSRKSNKARGNRENIAKSPEGPGSCSQSKKSKVQQPALKSHNQTVRGVEDACQARNGKCSKMNSRMQSAPDEEAGSSNQLQQSAAGIAGSGDDNSEEDLYRAEEEIEQERQEKLQPNPVCVVEDQNSVAAPECLLTYSEREWRGNTSKSRLIKKGYEAIAQTFEGLRRVRGDNYCALRATLFQLFSQSKELPAWLDDPEIVKWPSEVDCVKDLVDQWRFPFGNKDGGGGIKQLEDSLRLLKAKWQEAVRCGSPAERERVCQQVFVGGREEYELLEALKFLMLNMAIQLHADMQNGSSAPEFCCLLFARDTSKCPRSFFTNHLQNVGFNGGLEQVEMFLLGYSLHHTLQVYRLYKIDTEEFITYYPDDHRSDWPCLSLVTEDDRHYNVPVPKQSKPQPSRSGKSRGPIWHKPSKDKMGT